MPVGGDRLAGVFVEFLGGAGPVERRLLGQPAQAELGERARRPLVLGGVGVHDREGYGGTAGTDGPLVAFS